jgi:hypothetical protein
MTPGRQTRLPEVGTEGQKKLGEARVQLRSRDDASRAIEARYLEGAGVSLSPVHVPVPVNVPDPVKCEPFNRSGTFTGTGTCTGEKLHPSARVVAEGAWNALRSVREILGVKGDA